jgi:hypothetical protein
MSLISYWQLVYTYSVFSHMLVFIWFKIQNKVEVFEVIKLFVLNDPTYSVYWNNHDHLIEYFSHRYERVLNT